MKLEDVKKLDDILPFLDNLDYGWMDYNGEVHKDTLKGSRTMHVIADNETCIREKFGTCIEQVNIEEEILKRLNIETKKNCIVLTGKDGKKYIHCFLLAFIDGVTYHVEHAETPIQGIYRYDQTTLVKYFEKKYDAKLDSIIEYMDTGIGLLSIKFLSSL